MSKIHPTAVIEDGAILGSECVVEPCAYIGKNVILGDEVVVKQGARIIGNTKIGSGSKIYSYAIVGDVPQDISYRHEHSTGVVIGKNSTIREFCTINSGTKKGHLLTEIGDNAFIMAYSHIAHDCKLGNNVIMANNATLAGHVELGDYVVVGGFTPIHQFVKVGESCMIAGASALSQDIVPYCLAEGNRAYIRGLNLVGIRRRFSPDIVEQIKHAYRLLFRTPGSMKEKAANLLEQNPDQYTKKMCEFIMNTTRGIPLEKVKVNG